ncbi:hypothetical protein [Seleniivibrio woodruffii]|uniref:hypothetical protein n=1 Tax=Seleniivibrio woodruffii TaxID=1078050 RepID=UPI0024091DBB|nr:hypothetical protein [Seleniivibrio woodruffii]
MGSDKPGISLMTVEAYSLDSAYIIPNSTHAFVVGKNDRSVQWKNYGRGWETTDPKTLVATVNTYREWLMTYIPPGTEGTASGVNFGVNGVCHTFANRELLVADASADVRQAVKDEYAVFFFGKYGIGLDQLKQLLNAAYNNVTARYADNLNAYNTVMSRLNNYIDDELLAWRKIAIEEAGIDVDGILAKSPQAGLAIARQRLQNYINARESIYSDFIAGRLDKNGVQLKIKSTIIQHTTDYLNWLSTIHYITEADRNTYISRISAFLDRYIQSVRAMALHVESGNML